MNLIIPFGNLVTNIRLNKMPVITQDVLYDDGLSIKSKIPRSIQSLNCMIFVNITTVSIVTKQ